MTHDSLFNPCNYFLHQDCNKIFPINWQTQSLTLKLTLALGKSKTSTKTLVLLAIAQNGGGIWILFNTAYSRDATGLYCSLKATQEE